MIFPRSKLVFVGPVVILLIIGLVPGVSHAGMHDPGGKDLAPVIKLVDPPDDAAIHRTDANNNGVVEVDGVLPDIVRVQIGEWSPDSPADDLYIGSWTTGEAADFFRLDVVFRGVVSPPGPVGLNGDPYEPYIYGFTPLLGYIEVDVDNDIDTGGIIGSESEFRYLGSAARFGGLAQGPLAERTAFSSDSLDNDFFTTPFYERSGEDFALVFCGCFPYTVLELDGEDDQFFNEGNRWWLTGRFFARASGYDEASGTFGGSRPGAYDPEVTIQFQHDINTNKTTVSVVYPLTQAGAASMMSSAQVEPVDVNVGNQFSITEAIVDLIISADRTGLPADVQILIGNWADFNPDEVGVFLNPADWRLTAIFGMPYLDPEPDALVVWTDIAGAFKQGDLNGDSFLGNIDRQRVLNFIATKDGTERDSDGVVNGEVVIPLFSRNFVVEDVDGDGVVGPLDVAFYDSTPSGIIGDIDGDGDVDQADLGILLSAYGTSAGDDFFVPEADLDNDGVIGQTDLGLLLANFGMSV